MVLHLWNSVVIKTFFAFVGHYRDAILLIWLPYWNCRTCHLIGSQLLPSYRVILLNSMYRISDLASFTNLTALLGISQIKMVKYSLFKHIFSLKFLQCADHVYLVISTRKTIFLNYSLEMPLCHGKNWKNYIIICWFKSWNVLSLK